MEPFDLPLEDGWEVVNEKYFKINLANGPYSVTEVSFNFIT